jgi:hypothetical protein
MPDQVDQDNGVGSADTFKNMIASLNFYFITKIKHVTLNFHLQTTKEKYILSKIL